MRGRITLRTHIALHDWCSFCDNETFLIRITWNYIIDTGENDLYLFCLPHNRLIPTKARKHPLQIICQWNIIRHQQQQDSLSSLCASLWVTNHIVYNDRTTTTADHPSWISATFRATHHPLPHRRSIRVGYLRMGWLLQILSCWVLPTLPSMFNLIPTDIHTPQDKTSSISFF